MDLFEEFLELQEKAGGSFNSHQDAEAGAELECVIVEPRSDPRLPGVLMNFSATFPYAALTVCCSAENIDFVQEIVATNNKNNVKIIVISTGNITRDEYGALLKAPEFWELFSADKILIFQTDTGVRYNNILEFMQYDYIGAPWPWRPGGMEIGNGGLSLRSRRWMLYLTRRFGGARDGSGTSGIESEDLFFSHHLRHCADAILPTSEVADSFSIEYSAHPDPMGFHQFYLYHDRDYVRKLLEGEPGADHCDLEDIREAWIESARGDRYYHPRLVGWLRMGISRRDGLRISPRTRIPFAHDFAPGEAKKLVVIFSISAHEMHAVING